MHIFLRAGLYLVQVRLAAELAPVRVAKIPLVEHRLVLLQVRFGPEPFAAVITRVRNLPEMGDQDVVLQEASLVERFGAHRAAERFLRRVVPVVLLDVYQQGLVGRERDGTFLAHVDTVDLRGTLGTVRGTRVHLQERRNGELGMRRSLFFLMTDRGARNKSKNTF